MPFFSSALLLLLDKKNIHNHFLIHICISAHEYMNNATINNLNLANVSHTKL